MPAFPYNAIPTPQFLDLSFRLSPLRKGDVKVSVQTNHNPEQLGCDLLFPPKPNQSISAFTSFPACSASVRSTVAQGYGAMYGWIQLVQISPSLLTPDTPWEMDPVPITADLNTPFVWFGPEPSLFDAPMREGVESLDWKCHSFLAAIDDCVISKNVKPVLGFEWGFWIDGGDVSIKALREVKLEEWDEHLALLRGRFEGWTFRDGEGGSG